MKLSPRYGQKVIVNSTSQEKDHYLWQFKAKLEVNFY